MAILMNNNDYTCSCGCITFTIRKVYSFEEEFDKRYNKKYLRANTMQKELICTTCGKVHRETDFTIIEGQV